jgi:chromate transporter
VAEGATARAARLLSVLRLFLVLGCTSFGGPFAHLAYLRTAVVGRLGWLSEAAYAELIALCQLLPGPTSSQVCALVGFQRAGWPGALAAWAAFSAPSALLMLAAAGIGLQAAPAPLAAATHGLAIAALAVVALAAWSMAVRLCGDLPRRLIALAAAAGLVLVHGAAMQLAVLALAGASGCLLLRGAPSGPGHPALAVPGRLASLIALLAVLAALCLPPLALAGSHQPGVLAVCAVLARAGALVVGGGHVVLPLLQAQLVDPGLVDEGSFLRAYGLAQLMPGPLFSFSAYLGASLPAPAPGAALLNGLLALGALSLPGVLLALGAQRAFQALRASARLGGALAGLTAGAVGLLAAALIDPLARTALLGAGDLALLLAALAAIRLARWPSAAVAAGCALLAALC